MEINEKIIKNMGLCLFLGIISLVFIMYITEEILFSVLISSIIVGFLCTGLKFFDKYDEIITAAIYEFVIVFISFYVFVPFNSFISYFLGGAWATAILIWACIGAVLAAAICFAKMYFINKDNHSYNSNVINNSTDKIKNNTNSEKILYTDCPECGSIVKLDSIFCESCGSKIDTLLKDTVCMSCGNKLEKDSIFCEKCGTKKQ